MSPLEWWCSTRYYKAQKVEDESLLFSGPKASVALLVEDQQEADLAYALQLIYGGQAEIILYGSSDKDWRDYLDRFSRVYTSWDPFDRNRI